jgi:2'-hydroxyisoflavone reductase
MTLNRRELLLAASAAGLGSLAMGASSTARAASPKSVLVLGGTGFIGPHVVGRLLERGHDVTLFNRGQTNTDLFPGTQKLVGDRDNGLEALETGAWDAVIDNSGYVPRHVRDSAELLKGRVGRYLFTSTVAVYDFEDDQPPYIAPGAGQPGSPLRRVPEPESEDVPKYYGALKVLCEQYVNEIYGNEATIVRPTYVVGPGDTTQRYTWWVERIHRGGEIIVPGNADDSFGLIDVRDLADFVVQLVEDNRPGTFNASGPAGILSYAGMLESIRATTTASVQFERVGVEFLEQQEVTGRELPMWSAERGTQGVLFENRTSLDAGLSFRTLADTAAATLDWYQSLPEEEQAFTRAGLDPAREAKILAEWRSQRS